MGAEDDLRKHLLVPVLPLTGEGASSRGSAPHLMSIEDYEQTHHTKSIIRKMDVDTMPETTHLGCSTNTIASAPKMAPTGALTMAQFDEAFSAKHLAMKAAQAQAKAPTAAKTKTAVSPGLTELATKSSEYVVKLHTRCQALGIGLPHFDYTGTSSGGWSGKVSLPTVDVDELQDITVDDASFPLPSKGQVKEALSKQAFAALEQAIEQDKVHKAPKKNKGARAAGAQASMDLHDRVQKLALAQPVWEYDGSTNMGFTATAKFQGLDVEDLQAITNGQKYPSKILAKHATAPLVMEALKKAELDGKLGNGSVKVRVEPETAGVKIPGPNYSGQLLGKVPISMISFIHM